MKRAATFVLTIAAIVGLYSTATAMSFPENEPKIMLDGKLNCPYISSSGGTVYLQISLATSELGTRERPRRPMNLAVVLDRSGSMSDEHKMEYAKSALSKLIDQLNNEDIFSLVVYDDVIDVLRSAQRVGSNKSELKRLASDIYPRNSTNLGGGMIEGLRQVERNVGKEYVNRVVLLSDGLANQGVTSPHELNKIAKRYRHKSISLTTMGVGLDYNENLMVGLAESGGGNYYFIESPSQLASIMHREFNTLSSVVAQNAMLDLKLGQGVKLLDVIGCEHSPASDRHTIYIGDLYANETREFTVELSIPEAISAGRLGTSARVVAIGSLNYRSDSGRLHSTPTFTATVTYTRELAAIDKHRDLDVQAKADIAVSTRSVDQAMKALDEGRAEEAKRELSSARMMLMSSPAAAAQGAGASAIQEQASRLDSFNETLNSKDADARKAKKSIQYENYRVQKNK